MPKRKRRRLSIVGMAIGFALGISLDNWGVGIGVGVALAMVFGAHERGYLGRQRGDDPSDSSPDDESGTSK